MATQTLPFPTPEVRSAASSSQAFPERRASGRNKNFDLIRIAFAVMVMLAHAAEFTDGNRSRELFTRVFHANMTLGSLAVDGFFLLSGYLIVQSWLAGPKLGDFLRRRLLRIVPGYAVAAVFAVVAGGLLAPSVPHWWQLYWVNHSHNMGSLLFLSSPEAPSVYPALHYHQIDGSMWTIAYEFRCYLLVALLGVLGLLGRRTWAALTAGFTVIALCPPLQKVLFWAPYCRFFGEAGQDWRLCSFFCFGGCFFLFRDRIRFRPAYAVAAVLLQLLTLLYKPDFEPALALFGGYLLFYAGQLPLRLPAWLERMPDFSYGLYLYGAPVECLWITYVHGSPWVTFAGCTLIAAGLGWLSWIGVERPMLRFKPKRRLINADAFHPATAPAALLHPAL